MKDGLQQVSAKAPDGTAGHKQIAYPGGDAATLALIVKSGNNLAVATPISALAACNRASCARTSGRCCTSLEGKLRRQFLGQMQVGKF